MRTPDESRPAKPRIARLAPTGLTWADASELEPEDARDGERYDDADLSGRELQASSFTDCSFSRVRLSGADLRGVHLAAVLLDQVDATVLTAPRSSWRNVAMSGSRLGSAEVYESTWRSVVVTDTKINYLNARSAQWQDVIFRDCVIDELDLNSATLTRVALPGCRIAKVDAGHARLLDVDLRGTAFGTVSGFDGLAGAWIDQHQLIEWAPLLAAHAGIRLG